MTPDPRRLGPAAAVLIAAVLLPLFLAGAASAHGVDVRDAAFLEEQQGRALTVYAYLGAKHMVTGYDHLLYLLAVIFFLYAMKDVALYVTMFALGHSITLLTGVLANLEVDPYFVDGVIGLSIVYKAFENLGGFRSVFGVDPDPKWAVFCFGLIHGFGLATKLQVYELSSEGLVANILAFNLGVEIGQLLALSLLIVLVLALRSSASFGRYATAVNVGLLFTGFLLAGYQFAALATGVA